MDTTREEGGPKNACVSACFARRQKDAEQAHATNTPSTTGSPTVSVSVQGGTEVAVKACKLPATEDKVAVGVKPKSWLLQAVAAHQLPQNKTETEKDREQSMRTAIMQKQSAMGLEDVDTLTITSECLSSLVISSAIFL